MNILDAIIAGKKIEVEEMKRILPQHELETFPFIGSPCNSLVSRLLLDEGTGIIAEFKRKSPSKGVINDGVEIGPVVEAYQAHGAAGVSILTDEHFFGGTSDDLMYARDVITIPILRKDFIIDAYQLYEAKAIGADVILLIAACLSPKKVQELALLAKKLNLEVLLEIHNEDELQHICDEVDMVGVNNRDLKSFEVDLQTSVQLFDKIPSHKIAVTESGISNVSAIVSLKQVGYKGFLIGETFMKAPDPSIAFADFVNSLHAHEKGDF